MTRVSGLPRRHLPSAIPGAALLALGFLAWPTASSAQQAATSLVGTVTSAQTGQPVEGVEVVLVGEDRAAVTNADGDFTFTDLAAGSYTVRIHHGDAASRELTARLPAGTVTDLDVQVQTDPVPVGDLQVQVEGMRKPGKLAGFYRRKAQSAGLFLDGEDLSRMPGGSLTDALREQPGLGVTRCVAGGGPVDERGRRSGSSFGVRPDDEENPMQTGQQGYGERERERAADADRRTRGLAPTGGAPGREAHYIPGCQEIRVDRGGTDAGCRPQFYMDGSALPMNDPSMLRNLGGMDSGLLAGVEIYRGPSEVPAQYRTRDGCGVILLWTRTGGGQG